MSTTTPAPRSLFSELIDDAAVFPPAATPVAVAWREHLALKDGWYGDLIGPLLVSTSGVPSLVRAAADRPPVEDLETGDGLGPEPVAVAVVARPGIPVDDLETAVTTLRASPWIRVASVEVARDPAGTWRRTLELGLPVAVEVGRDPAGQSAALAEIARSRRSAEVLAKLRTQSTPSAPVPTPRELAEFLHGTRAHDLPFKLTGGLHHAVARTVEVGDGTTEEQHGLLNILVATHHLEAGATLRHLVATLELRESEGLASLARGLDEDAVAALRSRFRSFGCCDVLDPLQELVALDLLPA